MRKADTKGYKYEIISEVSSTADLRNGFIEAGVFTMDGSDRSW